MADEEEQPALPPPEGCKPMMIGMKNMDERYGLKTGPGMRDVLPFKLFNKEGANSVVDVFERRRVD